jgi:hypothetical protein
MSRPDFFEPKPISKNIHIKFEESKPIRKKPILRKRNEYCFPLVSILGKRKLEVAFGFGMNDKERYGQEIPPNFFKLNHGHNAYPSYECYTYNKHTTTDFTHLYEDRIQYWRQKYQTKR